MLIKATELINLPVIAEGYKVGLLDKPIVDPQNGKVLGFELQHSLLTSRKIISAQDIIQIGKNFVLINSAESILGPKEVIRIEEVLNSKIRVLAAKAYLESGAKLGTVEDLLINTTCDLVTKYYLHGLFRKLVLPAERVVRITKKGVIFNQNMNSAPLIKETEAAIA